MAFSHWFNRQNEDPYEQLRQQAQKYAEDIENKPSEGADPDGKVKHDEEGGENFMREPAVIPQMSEYRHGPGQNPHSYGYNGPPQNSGMQNWPRMFVSSQEWHTPPNASSGDFHSEDPYMSNPSGSMEHKFPEWHNFSRDTHSQNKNPSFSREGNVAPDSNSHEPNATEMPGKEYWRRCEVCSLNMPSLNSYIMHTKGLLHNSKLAEQARANGGNKDENSTVTKNLNKEKEQKEEDEDEEEDFTMCKVCNMEFKSMPAYYMHIRGISHHTKLVESEEKEENKNKPAANQSKPIAAQPVSRNDFVGTLRKGLNTLKDHKNVEPFKNVLSHTEPFKVPPPHADPFQTVPPHAAPFKGRHPHAHPFKKVPPHSEPSRQKVPSHVEPFKKADANRSDDNKNKDEDEDDDGDEYENWKFCEACQLPFKTPSAFLMHTRGIVHITKSEQMEKSRESIQQEKHSGPQTFRQDSRKRHQQSIPQNKPDFYCEVCDMDFKWQSAMDVHMKTAYHMRQKQARNKGWMETEEEYPREDKYEPQPKRPKEAEFSQDMNQEITEIPTDFYCRVCEVSTSGEKTYQQHILGVKHKKKLKRLGVQGNLNQVQGKQIDIVVNMSIPTKETVIQKVIDNCKDEPLIGLDYISEHHFVAKVQECRYFCELCQSKMDPRIFLSHVTGLRHRRRYLKFHYISLWEELCNMVLRKKTKGASFAKQFAQTVEEEEGRYNVRLRIEVTDEERKKNKDDPTIQHWEDGTAWEESELPDSRVRPISELPGILAEDEEDDTILVVVKKSKSDAKASERNSNQSKGKKKKVPTATLR